jgi:hypothetical protein
MLSSVATTPSLIVLWIYSFNPSVVPAWFDIRGLNLYNTHLILWVVVVFPVSLTFPPVERAFVRLTTWRPKLIHRGGNGSDNGEDMKAERILLSLSSKGNELQAVMEKVSEMPLLSSAGKYFAHSFVYSFELQ